MRRCLAITRSLNQCGRLGPWRFFCPEHKRQPVVWLSFLVFTVFAGIASMQSAWWHPKSALPVDAASFSLKMTVRYPGDFRLYLVNASKSSSGTGHIEVASWGDGAPAEDLRVRESFPNLIPGADWSYDVDLFAARKEHSGGSMPLSSFSGYVAIWCDQCARPQGWAFHVPGGNEEWPRDWSSQIPLRQFQYPSEKPGVGSRQ
jgi:hypothetical protein